MTVSIYFSERRVWWGNTYHRISDFWINQPLSSLLGPEFPEISPHSIYIRVWVWLGHLTVIEIKEKKEQTREINGRKPGKEYIKLSRIRKFSYHRNIFRAYKPSHSLKTTPIGVINREIQRERQTRIIYTEWKMRMTMIRQWIIADSRCSSWKLGRVPIRFRIPTLWSMIAGCRSDLWNQRQSEKRMMELTIAFLKSPRVQKESRFDRIDFGWTEIRSTNIRWRCWFVKKFRRFFSSDILEG